MWWEYPAFAAFIVFCFSLQQLYLYCRWRKIKQIQKGQAEQSYFFYYLSGLMVLFLLGSLYGGYFFMQHEENREKQEMKYIMDGAAPTLAYELKKLGHAAINLDTSGDDPAYLEMINTMVDWIKINPQIQSIYTFRKTPQGEVVFILGPETDYDRNGLIEGEKEARVPVGTVYTEVVPEIEAAFDGRYSFQESPTNDEWGSSISAFIPIYGEDSSIPEAVLGIDFDGITWSEVLQIARINAMGLVLAFLVLIDVFYLMFCHYWFDLEIEKQRELERERHIAYTDILTGLPNRAGLNEWMDREMERVRRGESAGIVLFIDLDDLKAVNDTFGHTYGDAIIIEAGKRISEAAGSDAIVGRIGGDEFLAILPGRRDHHAVTWLADGIISALCQDFDVFGERFHISASAGAAIYPDDGDTFEEIFKNADNAMYAAKNAGKNCWKYYDANMQILAYEKMLLTNSLRHAIERGELFVYYQPQVELGSGVVVGFEALLRWNSPEHGAISPVRFIPLAEQSGLIKTIGDWVLREACRFARRLADLGKGDIHVAVNVSPYQLCGDDYIDSVRNAINRAGIAPHQLELEITENALIASLKESTYRLAQLKAMGVRLALDDFGTGYSSLTYLQRLPVQTLKIDKAFTDLITTDGSHKEIVRSIVDLAHVMKMSVVAEGVETERQIMYLAQYRCDFLQGFFISQPLPEDDAVLFLSKSNPNRQFNGYGSVLA